MKETIKEALELKRRMTGWIMNGCRPKPGA
jgi:hypothetical protein